MTQEGFTLNSEQRSWSRSTPQLSVVASASVVQQFMASLDEDSAEALVCYAIDPAEAVPDDVVDDAHILVVEIDPQDPRSMRRVAEIRDRRPDLPQIVALNDANISTVRQLLRQGVTDVVSIPLRMEEILDSAADVAREITDVAPAQTNLCPMLAVVRAQGGEGATTLATQLAAELASRPSATKGVCIIDLDIQLGSVSPALGVSPLRNLDDLLKAGSRLDPAVMRSVAVKRGKNVDVIGAPDEIHPLEQVDTEQLLRILELARKEYSYVLLDLPSDWTSWNLSALVDATEVLMVIGLQISSLRQAKRRLELFKSVGVELSKVSIVVNRVERRLFKNISLNDVSGTLRRDVVARLHDEGSKISTAQDQGLLVSELDRKSKYALDVAKLADILTDKYSVAMQA